MERLAVRVALAQDAPAILALRLHLEDWLASRHVKQWGHGEVMLGDVARQIADGEWHVVSEDESLLGAVRLL